MLIQFAKFGLVGFVNTAIHYAVFYVLYSLFGVHYLVASAIGYAAGLVNSYLMNRTWTFKSRRSDKTLEFSVFVLVNVVSLGLNLIALKLLVSRGHVPPEFAQIIAIAFSLTANFAGNKFWTFKPSKAK